MKSFAGVPVKTLGLILFLGVLALVLTYIALIPQKNNGVPNTAEKITADTSLLITNTKKESGTIYSSDILIDSGKNKVTSVQLELTYDPSLLKEVSVVAGSFFESPLELLKKIDAKSGRITFALGLPSGSDGKSGKGVVATILYSPTFPNQPTVSIINFLPKTEVTAEDLAGSALKGTFDAIVDIKALIKATPTFAPAIVTPTITPTP